MEAILDYDESWLNFNEKVEHFIVAIVMCVFYLSSSITNLNAKLNHPIFSISFSLID